MSQEFKIQSMWELRSKADPPLSPFLHITIALVSTCGWGTLQKLGSRAGWCVINLGSLERLLGFKGRHEMCGRCRKFGGLFFAKIKHPLNLSCATRARFGDCQNYPLELRWGPPPRTLFSCFVPWRVCCAPGISPYRLTRPLCPALGNTSGRRWLMEGLGWAGGDKGKGRSLGGKVGGEQGDPTKAKEIPDNQKCDRIPRPGGGGGGYQGEENGAGIRDISETRSVGRSVPFFPRLSGH